MSNRVDEFLRRATKPEMGTPQEEGQNIHIMREIKRTMNESERREVERIVRDADKE